MGNTLPPLADLPGTVFNTGEVRAVRTADTVWVDLLSSDHRRQFGVDVIPGYEPDVASHCIELLANHADRHGRHLEERERIMRLARQAFEALA